MAEAKLEALLGGRLPRTSQGPTPQPATFSRAAADWLIYCQKTRDCKLSTLRDYANMVRVLDREFGLRELGSISSADIEHWINNLEGSNRTRQKYLVCLGSIFKRAVRLQVLPQSPVDRIERPRVRPAAKIDVLDPGEVAALIGAAHTKEDALVYALAAYAGLRIGEILALRWRDVDHERHTIHVRENWTRGETTTPKSGRERAVPMAVELARRSTAIRQRRDFNSEKDLVLCTPDGRHLGYKSLKLRYRDALKAAGLRVDFRFHNLRHTFGSTVIRHADARELMEWMGHADLATTQRYLAFIDREDAARRVSEAFATRSTRSPNAR